MEHIRNFEQLKRDFETAYAADGDYCELLYLLAKAVVSACTNKCMQTDAAHQHEYRMLKGQIEADYTTSMLDCADHFGKCTFCDGIDLIQEAVCVILEQAHTYGSDIGWLDRPYKICRTSSRAVIKGAGAEGHREEITTPLQECFRKIRYSINTYQKSHSSHGDLSLDSLDLPQLEALYITCLKYTEPSQTKSEVLPWDYEELLHTLNLTSRQERILTLRMQGYGYQAIATYLGISKSTVTRTLDRMKEKCAAMGIVP